MTKRKLIISAETAAEDLRSGMSDSDMMQKYKLSPKGLLSLYKKLLEAGIVDEEDMDRRMNALETTVELEIEKFPFEIAKGPALSTLKWAFKTGGWVFSSPLLWRGAVYFGSWDGNLYCLDLETGRSKWTFKTADVVRSSPVIGEDILYAGSWDHHLYAINARTGKQIWKFKTGQEVWSSPAVSEGTVYIGSTDGVLYAIDAKQGRMKWRFKSQGLAFNWVESSPIVVDGVVYFGTHGGDLYAVEFSNRRRDLEVLCRRFCGFLSHCIRRPHLVRQQRFQLVCGGHQDAAGTMAIQDRKRCIFLTSGGRRHSLFRERGQGSLRSRDSNRTRAMEIPHGRCHIFIPGVFRWRHLFRQFRSSPLFRGC